MNIEAMNNELSAVLSAHVASLTAAAPASAADAAQRKLDARLSGPRRASMHRPWIGWVAAAATACLVLTLSLVPMSRGVAFATVQKHLIDFSTLTLSIDQQSQGIDLPVTHVRMNREGDVRTDLGDAVSMVVSTRNHIVLTLLHDSHQAMQMPLDASITHRPGNDLAWLEEIRRFQGKATPLPGSRVIDGRPTKGWSLDTNGMHMVLWADADGLPRAVEFNAGQTRLTQHMQVTVDAPIDPSVFSTQVPAGYHLMTGDDR